MFSCARTIPLLKDSWDILGYHSRVSHPNQEVLFESRIMATVKKEP